jgi:PhnB protein
MTSVSYNTPGPSAEENIAMSNPKIVPEGYHTVTPYLIVKGAEKLLEFAKSVFDATVISTMKSPDGTLGHTEIRIGDSVLMLAEAREEWRTMPTMLYVYVADADATYQRSLAAGATSVRPVADQSYGDRSGGVLDMCGNQWWMATHLTK